MGVWEEVQGCEAGRGRSYSQPRTQGNPNPKEVEKRVLASCNGVVIEDKQDDKANRQSRAAVARWPSSLPHPPAPVQQPSLESDSLNM